MQADECSDNERAEHKGQVSGEATERKGPRTRSARRMCHEIGKKTGRRESERSENKQRKWLDTDLLLCTAAVSSEG